jgi:hypothetical protein
LSGDAIVVAAAVGIYYRSKLGYWVALCLTILSGVGAVAPLAGVPLVAMLRFPALLGLVSAILLFGPVLVVAAILLVTLRNWTGLEAGLRSLSLRWARLIEMLAIVGAAEMIFFEAIFRADREQPIVAGLGTASATEFGFWSAWFFVMCIPVAVYVLWSYGVLRSRETRDYFGLP